MKAYTAVLVGTIGLALLADQVREIGERIPYVLLSMWVGSATIAALIFSADLEPRSPAPERMVVADWQKWVCTMRRISVGVVPLALVPLLECRRAGFDPALLLMNGVLVVSLCSVPFWWLLARSIAGAVVLSIGALGLLWHFSAWALFEIIVRMEAAKEVSTVSTTSTLHAFLAPEYRSLFYLLCGTALLVYCPVTMWAGYRRSLADRTVQSGEASR